MNYIEQIAADIAQLVPADKLPQENTDSLFLAYAVLALAKGTQVTSGDVHHAWSAWMSGIEPAHASIVPFSELDPETQDEDSVYAEAIRMVGRHLR